MGGSETETNKVEDCRMESIEVNAMETEGRGDRKE